MAVQGANCGGKNGYRFSVLTHTIFENTKNPLKICFKVGYLMLVGKKGVSALQIHRVIFGEGRRCAAIKFALHWRREVDETYVGGKTRTAISARGCLD